VANPNDPNAGGGASAVKPPVRILTDERTNSLLVLAPRTQLEEVRRLVAKLDVPVPGGGRIHVYYLNNAKAEELADTLAGLVGVVTTRASRRRMAPGARPCSGRPRRRWAVPRSAPGRGSRGGTSVTADPQPTR
jgi:general secretion pathway protein D